jgi:hypothetical protein
MGRCIGPCLVSIRIERTGGDKLPRIGVAQMCVSRVKLNVLLWERVACFPPICNAPTIGDPKNLEANCEGLAPLGCQECCPQR